MPTSAIADSSDIGPIQARIVNHVRTGSLTSQVFQLANPDLFPIRSRASRTAGDQIEIRLPACVLTRPRLALCAYSWRSMVAGAWLPGGEAPLWLGDAPFLAEQTGDARPWLATPHLGVSGTNCDIEWQQSPELPVAGLPCRPRPAWRQGPARPCLLLLPEEEIDQPAVLPGSLVTTKPACDAIGRQGSERSPHLAPESGVL